MGRQLRSPLDLVKPDPEGRVVNEQLKQKRRHDDHAGVREFDVGDTVFAKNFGQGDKWLPATIRTGPMSYQVEVEGWHIDQIRVRFITESVQEPPPPCWDNPAIVLPGNSPVTESTFEVETENIHRYPIQEQRPPDRLTYGGGRDVIV